ncbi:thioesterase family protein [Sphingopyxis sp.]|uniref:acyl-CoA thioesterase n=1 Tax=Sphingopyxis sp. TaxID=1908224 RepID=UPI0031202CC0
MTTGFRHYTSFRVRFAEIDGQLVVFNSRYLEYADNVLTEFMRAIEVPVSGPHAFEMQVVQATVHYKRGLRFDDEVEGWLRVERVGRSSAIFEIEFRLKGSEECCASVTLAYVHVDLATEKSQEIPAAVRSRMLGERDCGSG